ncbi:hypothetical protein MYP_2063 [Sporocytophaga myxococcoides]|uniref:Uncharacterized protein n=1 Tax=Sporocytophaga myxococcoides TaxID=153721 RepID=A0A098LD52_9BACT|nr:hypothetical protein MYP_2063 [Sporocytophaga myxococcoides]
MALLIKQPFHVGLSQNLNKYYTSPFTKKSLNHTVNLVLHDEILAPTIFLITI